MRGSNSSSRFSSLLSGSGRGPLGMDVSTPFLPRQIDRLRCTPFFLDATSEGVAFQPGVDLHWPGRVALAGFGYIRRQEKTQRRWIDRRRMA